MASWFILTLDASRTPGDPLPPSVNFKDAKVAVDERRARGVVELVRPRAAVDAPPKPIVKVD